MIKAFWLCLMKYIRYAPSAGKRRLLPNDLASEKENQIELLELKNVITKVNSVDKLIANQACSWIGIKIKRSYPECSPKRQTENAEKLVGNRKYDVRSRVFSWDPQGRREWDKHIWRDGGWEFTKPIQIQEVQWTPIGINKNKSTLTHIIVKLLITKGKEDNP